MPFAQRLRPLVLATTSLALSACASTALRGPGPGDLAEFRETAADYGELPLGEHKLLNNVWGSDRALWHEQRIFTGRDGDGRRVFGWSWRWPQGWAVGGYPEVMFGASPWHPSRTPKLPRPVSPASLPVRWSAHLASTGSHNLAFDLWITRGPEVNPSTIAAEVMIWVADRGTMGRLGELRDRPSLEGARWAVYVADGVTIGQPQGSRRYIAFIAQKERLVGELDLGAFLGYLLERGLVDSGTTLASVELGTEVASGAGSITFDEYQVAGVPVE